MKAMRLSMAGRVAAITLLLTAILAHVAGGQTPVRLIGRQQNEVQLSVEPVRLGAQYQRGIGPLWQAGLAVGAGPLFAVTLRSANVREVRSWADAHTVVALRTRGGMGLFVSPIGAALVVGDDFGAVYPSGQAGWDFRMGPLRVASLVRVIRIAGANGSGTWWTQWVPLRLAYVLP